MIPQNIHRSARYEDLVQRLSGSDGQKYKESSKTLFPTIREFLSFAGLLGFSEGRKLPFEKGFKTEDIAGAQFQAQGQVAMEIIHAIGVAHTNSIDILKEENDKQCAEVFEEYVNGGLQIIEEWLAKEPHLDPYQAIQSGLRTYKFLPNDNEEAAQVKPGEIDF